MPEQRSTKWYLYDRDWSGELYGPFWSHLEAENWALALMKHHNPDFDEDEEDIADSMFIFNPVEPGTGDSPPRVIEQVS